ncbi:DUF6344 domain-containing protein [Streptomyces sp. NPDC059618]|uniref:DUF6344 domain-containing protein n=1 Tax=Streptomyces sp. NPDC059618 TaxID=3346887 RepID=UPI003694CB15
MTQNKVMKLWSAIVTAFLALCTTLGLVTTAAAAAVPQAAPARNTEASVAAATIAPAPVSWTRPSDRALPPTMKQRIRAEAHGSSPSCRQRVPAEDGTAELAAPGAPGAPEGLAEPDACSGPETFVAPGTEALGALTPVAQLQH